VAARFRALADGRAPLDADAVDAIVERLRRRWADEDCVAPGTPEPARKKHKPPAETDTTGTSTDKDTRAIEPASIQQWSHDVRESVPDSARPARRTSARKSQT
jgi:hypothetical protein